MTGHNHRLEHFLLNDCVRAPNNRARCLKHTQDPTALKKSTVARSSQCSRVIVFVGELRPSTILSSGNRIVL